MPLGAVDKAFLSRKSTKLFYCCTYGRHGFSLRNDKAYEHFPGILIKYTDACSINHAGFQKFVRRICIASVAFVIRCEIEIVFIIFLPLRFGAACQIRIPVTFRVS